MKFMETSIFLILAAILFLIGFIGCLVPGVPGTPFCWAGLLCISFDPSSTVSLTSLVLCGALCIAVEIVNYIVPAYFAKKSGGSKEASVGTIIGTFVGIFCAGVGVFPGAFCGALIGELYHQSKNKRSGNREADDNNTRNEEDIFTALKVALWSFLGFITGIGLKITASVIFLAVALISLGGFKLPQ